MYMYVCMHSFEITVVSWVHVIAILVLRPLTHDTTSIYMYVCIEAATLTPRNAVHACPGVGTCLGHYGIVIYIHIHVNNNT